MRGGMLLRMKKTMSKLKLLKTMLKDQGIKYTELCDYGIRVDYIHQVKGLDIPGLIVAYVEDGGIRIADAEWWDQATNALIAIVLILKKQNAWVDGRLFRDV